MRAVDEGGREDRRVESERIKIGMGGRARKKDGERGRGLRI